MRITLPTAITLFRVALIPLFVVVFYLPFSWANVAATSIFFVASVSDWVDGYLARNFWNQNFVNSKINLISLLTLWRRYDII